MKRLFRFVILAVIGFALGAGFAYFQSMKEADIAAQQVIAEATPLVPPVPEQAEIVQESQAQVAAEQSASPEAAEATAAPQPAEAVQGSSVGGAFSLIDHHGKPVTQASWPEKHKMVFFGFTSCPDICPAALDKMTTALNALGDVAQNIQPLFITVDPERDTAELMKTYLGGYHPSIIGLTGSKEDIKAAMDAYKVYAAKVPGVEVDDYTMNHSSFVFLMTPDDQLLDVFGSDDTAENIVTTTRERLAVAAAILPPGPGDTLTDVVEGVSGAVEPVIETVAPTMEGVAEAVEGMVGEGVDAAEGALDTTGIVPAVKPESQAPMSQGEPATTPKAEEMPAEIEAPQGSIPQEAIPSESTTAP